MKKVLYKKSQYGTLITVIIALVAIVIIGLTITQTGEKPIPPVVTVCIIILLILVIATFYKLTITITNTKIEAKFGIGLLKRSLEIKDINYSSFKKINIPALYGIGIRITPYGLLYNVKLGEAIRIKSSNKTFFVGTDDADAIHKVLLQLKPE